MDRFDLLVVGGGLAGARTVETYRGAGGGGSVALVAAEQDAPYHRPPLTKKLLRGEAEPVEAFVRPAAGYADLDVELRLGAVATGLDLEDRRIELSSGERLAFDRLVVATGATPRRLAVPGADLAGVQTLRRIGDSLAIRERARAAGSAVVVGAGFIGLETAASLRMTGAGVTLVAPSPPFAPFNVPAFSEYLVRRFRDEGVELIDDGVAAFEGDGQLAAVRTRRGRTIPSALAVVGVGVQPETAWLEGSGVALDDGVLADEAFRSSVDGVFAVGDVARFRDPVFSRLRRIEHWSNADYHGRVLGAALAGESGVYDRVSAFFTEIFGTVYTLVGDPEGADAVDVEGDFAGGRAIARLRREGRLSAALVTGIAPEERDAITQEIREQVLLPS